MPYGAGVKQALDATLRASSGARILFEELAGIETRGAVFVLGSWASAYLELEIAILVTAEISRFRARIWNVGIGSDADNLPTRHSERRKRQQQEACDPLLPSNRCELIHHLNPCTVRGAPALERNAMLASPTGRGAQGGGAKFA